MSPLSPRRESNCTSTRSMPRTSVRGRSCRCYPVIWPEYAPAIISPSTLTFLIPIVSITRCKSYESASEIATGSPRRLAMGLGFCTPQDNCTKDGPTPASLSGRTLHLWGVEDCPSSGRLPLSDDSPSPDRSYPPWPRYPWWLSTSCEVSITLTATERQP